MTDSSAKPVRVLAIDPTTKGFGFAVLESPEMLIDWGVKETREQDKQAQCLKLFSTLLNHFTPDVIVTERTDVKASRRCDRIKELIEMIRNTAAERKVAVRQISKSQMEIHFSRFGAATKHEIARVISEQLPELAPRVPRFRHPWMSEDPRMAIFDALAMALTFYETRRSRRRHPLLALGIYSSNHVQ